MLFINVKMQTILSGTEQHNDLSLKIPFIHPILLYLQFKFHNQLIWLVELVLYVLGQQLRSCRDSQLSYPHCFGKPPRGRLPVLSDHPFTIN